MSENEPIRCNADCWRFQLLRNFPGQDEYVAVCTSARAIIYKGTITEYEEQQPYSFSRAKKEECITPKSRTISDMPRMDMHVE